MTIDAESLRRMIAGQEAAAALGGSRWRPPTPAAAFAAAMELLDLCPGILTAPPDPIRLRDEAQARASWARLRAQLLP
ncbi:MAG: hypothetical protein CME06_09505 [Gemmatimonadetes bacterium]|nr:hypothetical protein [Gemmatimonadota bacterium]